MGEKTSSREPSVSPKRKASTTTPLIKKRSSILKPHPLINPDQPPNHNIENKSKSAPTESEEPLLNNHNSQKQQQQQQQSVNQIHIQNTTTTTTTTNSLKKMEQSKQPQIHPTPLQPQMSQISHMAQPTPGIPSYQSQILLQNPSQAQLYNTPGQYSITVNTNDPNAFTTMMMPSVVSRNPVQMRCPYCNENIVTVIKYENNSLVWILTILLFIFCCCCFCIPLLIDDIKDVIHYCPICSREIARIDR